MAFTTKGFIMIPSFPILPANIAMRSGVTSKVDCPIPT